MSTIFLVGIVTPFTLSALVPVLLLFYWLYVYFQVRVVGWDQRVLCSWYCAVGTHNMYEKHI